MTKRLLLIDDSPSLLKALAGTFEDEEYQVVTAYDLKSGLSALKQGPFDLIVSDKDMLGDEEAGLKLLAAARLTGNMPIILMSGGVIGAAVPLIKKKLKEIGGETYFLDKSDLKFTRNMEAIAREGMSFFLPSRP